MGSPQASARGWGAGETVPALSSTYPFPEAPDSAFASTCNVAAGARFDGVPGIMHAAPSVMHVTSE